MIDFRYYTKDRMELLMLSFSIQKVSLPASGHNQMATAWAQFDGDVFFDLIMNKFDGNV